MVLEAVSTGAVGTDVDDLLDQAARVVHRDPASCTELLRAAEERIAGQRDLVRSARIAALRGRRELVDGNLAAATTAFRLARRNWLAAGRSVEARLSELGSTQVQLMLGEFDAAVAEVKRIQAHDWDTRGCEHQLARLNAAAHGQLADGYAGVGTTALAMRHYDIAEDLYRAFGDSTGIAAVRMRRGVTMLDLGMPHRALAELTAAHLEFQRIGWEQHALYTAIHVADALSMTGQIARGLELLERIRPQIAGKPSYVATHDLSHANVLLRAGLPVEAHAAARAAEEAFTDLGLMELSARAALACASASLRLGRVDAATGELTAAERLFAECGARLKRGWTWLGQARLALSVGDEDHARELCRRVLSTGARARRVDDVSPHLALRAHLLAARTVPDADAADHLTAAAELAASTGVPELRMEVSLGRARHHRRSGDTKRALEELRRTLGVGHAWARPAGDPLDSPVRSVLTEATDELIEVLLERDDHAARVEAWQRANAAKRASVVPLAERTRGWVPDPTDERRRVAELVHDADEPAAAAPSTATDGVLPSVPSRSFVEYFVSGDDIVAFVGREGQVEARRLRATAGETRRLVSAWQQECWLIAAAGSGSFNPSAASPALDLLFDLLLAPVADLLADLDEDLEVFGHRHLHAVPFDALLDEGAPWHSRLGVLPRESQIGEPWEPRAPTALVLAVPDRAAPSIAGEAEMIFRTLPTAEILLGERATRHRLAERAANADVVHLACHGVFRSGNPLFSALRLGDGWLSARDILRSDLGLRGSVVVLSACSSGLASDHVSEPLGLAWACLAAGARSVIAALWPVDDDVTLELMTHFYAGLAAGMPAPAALRDARGAIARERPHPYYWAAFRCFTAPEDQLVPTTR